MEMYESLIVHPDVKRDHFYCGLAYSFKRAVMAPRTLDTGFITYVVRDGDTRAAAQQTFLLLSFVRCTDPGRATLLCGFLLGAAYAHGNDGVAGACSQYMNTWKRPPMQDLAVTQALAQCIKLDLNHPYLTALRAAVDTMVNNECAQQVEV